MTKTNRAPAPRRPPRKRPAPRDRILTAAADLFYRHGIRGIGVDAIARAADTNKMAIYRHFKSKDDLIAQWLRGLTLCSTAYWDRLADEHPADPRAQMAAWIRCLADKIAHPAERGCAFANALAELPDKNHPARRIIEEHKLDQRQRFVRLCREARIPNPELIADELFFLLEGAQASAQSLGARTVSEKLVRMADSLIAGPVSA